MLKEGGKTVVSANPARVFLEATMSGLLDRVCDQTGMKMTHLVQQMLLNSLNKGNEIVIHKNGQPFTFAGENDEPLVNLLDLINSLEALDAENSDEADEVIKKTERLTKTTKPKEEEETEQSKGESADEAILSIDDLQELTVEQ